MNTAETIAVAATSGVDAHARCCSYREKMLEHVFVGEVMRRLWVRGVAGLEVLRPVVDDGGYDVALAVGPSVRYVQLKSSYRGSAVRGVRVNARLASKPGACVVWVQFDPDTIDIGPFLWFGDPPGQPLTDLGRFKVAKHTKGNARGVKLERPNIRVIPRAAFTQVATIDELLTRLFGDLSLEGAAGTLAENGLAESSAYAEAETRQNDLEPIRTGPLHDRDETMTDSGQDYEADQREAELITARALVFDGYRYAQDHELTGPDDDWDFSGFIHDFLADPNFDLPRGHLHCAVPGAAGVDQGGLAQVGLGRGEGRAPALHGAVPRRPRGV